MNTKIFRQSIAILILASMLLLLSGCNQTAKEAAITTDENTITDGAGRTLTIPEDIDEYSISSVYAVAVPFIVALGLTDRVAAINVKSSFWKEANEDLAKAGSVGRGTVDLEKLAGLAPTVLIHRSNDPETVEAVSGKLGIDVFCITVEGQDDINNTLMSLGKYFHREERAKEICSWMDEKFAWMNELIQDIPQEERKTALVMGGQLSRVAGNDMLQSRMIEQAGGICAVDQGKDHNWINAGVENVFRWNPDYLFITGSTGLEYDPEALIEDSVWSGMTAVQNGHIYRIPAQADSWDMPGISCVLGTMYMLHTMYPDRLDAETFQEQIDEYYRMMFRRTFDADELGYTIE